jgi:predicted HTH domain antitoxin
MTRAQKKQYVIQLHEEGKDFKQIAKLAHMSLRDITAIVKEHQDKIERENGQLEERDDDYDFKSKSKATQATKLFSEGKTPVDVVVTLDLQSDEVQEIYRDFLKLQNMHELVKVFDEMQNFLPSFLELEDCIKMI